MCVGVAFFALTLCYILLSFSFYIFYMVFIHMIVHEQSHTIAHLQGLTNGLSGRDYGVLTISPPHVQNKYITTWNIKN